MKNVLNYKKPAFWLIAVAVVACGVVTACFATNPVTEEPSTPNAERPTLIVDGNVYVNPYMPVSYLPYGYQSAGKLTREQANNTGLEGIEYFVHPSETEDFYTYQECGTPIDQHIGYPAQGIEPVNGQDQKAQRLPPVVTPCQVRLFVGNYRPHSRLVHTGRQIDFGPDQPQDKRRLHMVAQEDVSLIGCCSSLLLRERVEPDPQRRDLQRP